MIRTTLRDLELGYGESMLLKTSVGFVFGVGLVLLLAGPHAVSLAGGGAFGAAGFRLQFVFTNIASNVTTDPEPVLCSPS